MKKKSNAYKLGVEWVLLPEHMITYVEKPVETTHKETLLKLRN